MRRFLVFAAALLASAPSGCTSSGTSSSNVTTSAAATGTTHTATTPPITTATTLPTAFTGTVDAFYHAPDPLPRAQPGTLIRYQPIARTADESTWRIMYHSIDAAGRDQPTTGTISFPGPARTAPARGWPVVSTGPGTVGLSPTCALSRTDEPPDAFGVEGVAVRTDYIGMVDGQLQRYLSGPSEAHSMIDAVRAARNIPAAHAGVRWVAFGHSQGGHAALFTNQLAHDYAPELDLLGTVVGAPASELTRLYGDGDRVIPHVVELLGLFGIAQDHPGSDPTAYLSAEAKKHVSVLTGSCMDEIIPTFAPLAADGLFAKDPLTTPPASTFVRENETARVASPEPIMLFEGTRDAYVVPARAADTRKRLCALGQTTQYLLLDGADHGTEIEMARPEIESWINDRFAGKPAPDNCADR